MRKYKALWFVGIASLSVVLTGCGIKDLININKVSDQIKSIVDTDYEYVLAVKDECPDGIPGITYGEAFESFFSDPTWVYYESEDGEDVVEFSGGCTYRDADVTARLQFILHDNGQGFEVGALKLNDILQTESVIVSLVYTAFENYAEENDIQMNEDIENLGEEVEEEYEPPVTENTKAHYSMEEIGVPTYSGTPFYQIRGNGNIITYRKYDTSRGSDEPEIGQWKQAELTASTEYYEGDSNRFYRICENYIDEYGSVDYGEIPFIKKSTKAKFDQYYRESSYEGWADLVIRDGKIESLIFNAWVAG